MRAFPLTALQGGIDRLQVKGGTSANKLYDLTNAYITNAGSIAPREGTIRAATLTTQTVGLMAMNGTFNIFSNTFTTSTATVPAGYQLNVLVNPVNSTATPTIIWFAKPFMGFPYVVAEFNDNSVYHYWLQNNGSWTSNTVYTSASIVLPTPQNGLAYQGIRDFPPNALWSAEASITSQTIVEPTVATGYAYKAISTTGTNPHTGSTEPVWPAAPGAIIQEFGDFGTTAGAATTTTSTAIPLGSNITDKYGNSSTIANVGSASSALTLPVTASTKVTTWAPGTHYAPGSVVQPTTNQGAFVGAIPNGDFEAGDDGNWVFTNTGGSSFTYDSTMADAYQGTWCLKVPGGSGGSGGSYATMLTSGSVSPGQSVTLTGYVNPNNQMNGDFAGPYIGLLWYDKTNTEIGSGNYEPAVYGPANYGTGYRKYSVTAAAPPGAAGVRATLWWAYGGESPPNPVYFDAVSWNLETPATVSNFLYEAVQPTAGSSAAHEPTWPTTIGNTVVDNTVTWQAIGTSIITWEAIPLMLSGGSQPTFPTTVGNTVTDNSTFTDKNGVAIKTTMSWQCISRVISDLNDPNTIPVALGASHVFAGNNDIVPYSAAVNPTDWTSTNNAGYLPTGLNNYGDNPVAMFALYRSNLMAVQRGRLPDVADRPRPGEHGAA